MFTPHFQKDNATISYYLDEIERVKYRVERTLIMPKHELWLQREAFIRNAYSSTMVENPSITDEEMEEAAKPSPAAQIAKERPDVTNYGRSLEFVDYLSDSGIAADESAIRQIHWFLMKGINDFRLKPGTYRTEPNWIHDQGVKAYEPPFHIDVPLMMRDFSEWLRGDEDTQSLLKAGIAHAHLVAIHPFADGNGRTGRLLATLLLQRSGNGFRKLLSLDAYYQRNRDEYIDALRKSIGQKYTHGYDLTPWLEFFTYSVLAQGKTLERRLTDWRMTVDRLHRDLASTGLSDRQLDGLIYAANTGYIARKDYAEIAGVSLLTATRDLADLAAKGLLVAKGKGRNRKYHFPTPLNPEETNSQG